MRRIRMLAAVLPVAMGAMLGCGENGGATAPSRDTDAGVKSGVAAPHAPDFIRRSRGHAADAGVAEPPPASAPAASSGGAPCVLSADCQSGEHCDLGECYQECNDHQVCRNGKTCSARGRCLAEGESDADPTPAVTSKGTVQGDTGAIELTDRDDVLRLHVSTDSKESVRYRVEISAPYLTIASPRGEFSGETTIKLAVDGSRQTGQDLAGSVRVITSLGDVPFATSMKVGLTGSYQGSLSYDGVAGGPIIGTTKVGLDVKEDHGDVVAGFASDRSLLFPATAGQSAVTGRGSFTYTDGLDVVLRQVLPAGFGGKDDVFRRDIGREIRLHVTPGDRGSLDGTFEEHVYGLLKAPVTLSGHAHFERIACADGSTTCSPHLQVHDVKMPATADDTAPDLATIFPGWSLDCVTPDWASDSSALLQVATLFDVSYHRAFADNLAGISPLSTDPLGDLAGLCEWEGSQTSDAQAVSCAKVPRVACTLDVVARAKLGRDAYDTLGTLFAHTLDVPVFLAQNDLVKAVKASFADGPHAETSLLDHAKGALQGPLTWVMQPELLESLAQADPKFHRGHDEPPSALAARTLARLLLVRSTVAAERARLDRGARIGEPAALRFAVQQKGVEALLEAAVLFGISESWKAPPPELGSAFIDVLTPIDAGFSALLQGAAVFGVPEGFVLNVYEPGRKLTNFEQLLDIADSAVQAASSDEKAFKDEDRTFESNEDDLAKELENVSSGYESQIQAACGNAFPLDNPDWSRCGMDQAGTVGSKLATIDEAIARLSSAQCRIDDKRNAIEIEKNRIAEVTGAREETVSFTIMTGERLEDIDVQEATLNGVEKAIEIASQASVWNGGAPIFEALGAIAIEDLKGQLEASRQNAQTMQDVQVQLSNLSVEQSDSAATIKGLLVDMAQARVEMQEQVLGVVSARVDAENALADAKRAALQRTRALDRIGHSSLRDPTARLLRSRNALNALRSRAAAQTALLQAGRGLEYHLNHPIGKALDDAVFNAFDGDEQVRLRACLQTVFDQSRGTLPKTQSYTTDVSVRKLLGIQGPRKDEVTGEMLSPGAQLRQVLLRNQNLDGKGGVSVEITTTLDPGNELWSSNVCDDRITQVEAELVGDFLGDNEAEVQVALNGGGVFRTCEGGALMSWSTSGHAVVQAGVNTFGTAPQPNDSLNGLAVASSKWEISIPGPSAAPANQDLDLTKLEDIVLRVHHQARPIPENPLPLAFDCLDGIGGG